MIKKFKQFESLDTRYLPDDFSEARHILSDSESFVSFAFDNNLIKDIDQINELIDVYKKTSIRNNEWGGGPINKEFVDYFAKKYQSKPYYNSYKPSINLTVITSLGIFIMIFSIIDRGVKGVYMTPYISKEDWIDYFSEDFIKLGKAHDNYSSKIRTMESYDREMIETMIDLWRKQYDEKKTLGEVIDFFSLDPDNYDSIKW
jgi:hypothetical protein